MASAIAHLGALPGNPIFEGLVSLCDPVPVPDGTATRVLCSEVIEHLDTPSLLMSEMVSIGQPGALYLFTCPDPQAEALQKYPAPPRA